MSLREIFELGSAAVSAHAAEVLIGSLVFPAVATLAAFLGRLGKTDRDGRAVASWAIGVAVVVALVGWLFLAVSASILAEPLLGLDVRLLVAPPLVALLTFLGISAVFPLASLRSVQLLRDVALLLLLCAAALWFLSKFRGWGIVFFAPVAQLLVAALFGWAIVKKLLRRIAGGTEPAEKDEALRRA